MRTRLTVTALGLAALALLGSAATATAAVSSPDVRPAVSKLVPMDDNGHDGHNGTDQSVGTLTS
ncbi:hypothetical protein [Streptomyces sp. NPDC050485]|uniref:hypothetical protein n=1 Tax=Streptomyces sp. NPDC050485 TaxID=3365617 RepID=UPI0037A3669F